MDEHVAICKYLSEFLHILDSISDEETELKKSVREIISFHQDPQTTEVYLYTKMKNEVKNEKQFGVMSIAYLLERRKLIIHGGLIYLRVKAGVVPIDTGSGKEQIASDYSLSPKEVNSLMGCLFMVKAACKFQDLSTGDMIRPTVPSTFNPDLVQFADCWVDMKQFKFIEPDPYQIPATRLFTNFKNTDPEGVSKLKELLLFISDYDPIKYHRLCKIMAYAYTHKKLEKMFVMLGKGRNGKGVFLQFIEKLCVERSHTIGSMTSVSKSSSSAKEGQILEMLTARATLVEEEIDFSKNLFDESYKNLVTGGSGMGRKLGSDAVSVPNQSIFYVATNWFDFTDIQQDDYAFMNRVVFTDFTNKFVQANKNDDKIVSEALDPHNRAFNFKNILNLLMDELEHDSLEDLTGIESQKSQYLKNVLFESPNAIIDKVCASIQNAPALQSKDVIEFIILAEVAGVSVEAMEQAFKDADGFTVIDVMGSKSLKIDESMKRRKITMDATAKDFSFCDRVDLNKLTEVSQSQIRVTEAMYQLGITGVSKEDMTEFCSFLSNIELKFYEEQPFIKAVAPLETVPEPTTEPDDPNKIFLDLLLAGYDMESDGWNEAYMMALMVGHVEPMEPVVETAPVEQGYDVSVFDCGCYPISNVHYRDRLTSDIPSLLSPLGVPKEATLKILPYEVETRGDDIIPSKWFAVDYDACSNPSDIKEVVKTFEGVGYECYIQESVNSHSCSKCGKDHTKFHILFKCDAYTTQLNYKPAREFLGLFVPYDADENYRYKTIMNCSFYEWHHVEGQLFPMSSVKPVETQSDEKIVLEDGREVIQDRSNLETIADYLGQSDHETARLFADMIRYGSYTVGNRDDSVYAICMYLNESLIDYNMRPDVYHDGYAKLRDIVESHPVNDNDKFNILRKLNHYEYEV